MELTGMQRRKFVIGMGALATGTAAAVGSGAFTSVDAERDLEIDVVNDNDALLAMSPTEHPNAAYLVDDGSGDPLDDGYTGGTIAIGMDDVMGEGVNNEAVTYILDIFRLKNQGTQEVRVHIGAHATESPRGITSSGTTRVLYRLEGETGTGAGSAYHHPEYGDVYHFAREPGVTPAHNWNPLLAPGDSITVGLRFDTRVDSSGSISGELDRLEITAYELGLPE